MTTPERQREWVLRNREHVRAYQKAWREANREKSVGYARRWRAANGEAKRRYDARRYLENRDVFRGRAAAWYRENKVRALACAKEYYAVNLEKKLAYAKAWGPAWRRANPAKAAARAAHQRARRRGALGSHTAKQWEEKKALFANCCVYCGEPKRLEREHAVPLIRGGTDDISNILPACRSCNSKKGTRTAREYLGLVA